MTGPADVVYVAPARRLLGDLHIPAGETPPATRCGEPMGEDELWQEIERQPGDKVCPGCEGRTVQPQVRGEGLW